MLKWARQKNTLGMSRKQSQLKLATVKSRQMKWGETAVNFVELDGKSRIPPRIPKIYSLPFCTGMKFPIWRRKTLIS